MLMVNIPRHSFSYNSPNGRKETRSHSSGAIPPLNHHIPFAAAAAFDRTRKMSQKIYNNSTAVGVNYSEIRLIEVHRSQCHFKVYIQGDGANWSGKTVFLTVHDVGSNPTSFIDFVNEPSMGIVKRNSIFLHICVPGQEDGAPDIVGDFPSMDQLGENLVHVLDALDINICIGLGEGAGADIICRFAMSWPNRVLGLILLHCLSTPHGIIESFKEILTNIRLEDGRMNSADWDYLFAHRFGLHSQPLKESFIKELDAVFNDRNLSRYLYSFSRRSDLTERIRGKLNNTPVLLITGARTPHLENVRHMHEQLRPDKSSLLVIDEVLDVMAEVPDRLSRALILFCKGLGELSSVPIPGVGMNLSRGGSMEEADKPTGRFSPKQKIVGKEGKVSI